MSAELQPYERAPFRIAPPTPADQPYVLATWRDSFHRARENMKRSFSGGYKAEQTAAIVRLLDSPETRVLCAYNDAGRCIGWLVWTPGRSVSTVHYVYVRHDLEGVQWRRQGVARALLEHANLGRRVVYTHRGEYRRGGKHARQHYPRPLDEELVDWARKNGVAVVYEPLREWWT